MEASLMNKGDLITSVALATSLTKRNVKKVLNATFQSMTASLKKGESVRWLGWGTFAAVERKATIGRHPRTGEKIQIPAKHVVRFTSGKALKEAVTMGLEEAAATTSKEEIKAEQQAPKVIAKDDTASSAKTKKSKK